LRYVFDIKEDCLPAPSPVLDCRALYWQALVCSAGGDGVRRPPNAPRKHSQVVCGSQRLPGNPHALVGRLRQFRSAMITYFWMFGELRWFGLPFRSLARLAQKEELECTGREPGGGRGLGQKRAEMTTTRTHFISVSTGPLTARASWSTSPGSRTIRLQPPPIAPPANAGLVFRLPCGRARE
jgi:hypothetical protein